MATLTRAHQELFRRTPDECYDSFDALHQRCRSDREQSKDLWVPPQDLMLTNDLTLCLGDNPDFQLNEWSFTQLCRMAGVSKDTINRLSPKTASKAFQETLPTSDKPLQILTEVNQVRSVHGVAYTRLWNVELLDVVQEFAADFTPPQRAVDGRSTGLYCGEQDMFAFLIDPAGWAEIEGQAGFRSRILHLEFGSWPPNARHPNVLVSANLPKPHRLGRRRSCRVYSQAHGQCPRGAR